MVKCAKMWCFYVIVQTLEPNGTVKLFTVPERWTKRRIFTSDVDSKLKGDDQLLWPPKNAKKSELEKYDLALRDTSKTVDLSSFTEHRCKIKRMGFKTYDEVNILKLLISICQCLQTIKIILKSVEFTGSTLECYSMFNAMLSSLTR